MDISNGNKPPPQEQRCGVGDLKGSKCSLEYKIFFLYYLITIPLLLFFFFFFFSTFPRIVITITTITYSFFLVTIDKIHLRTVCCSSVENY